MTGWPTGYVPTATWRKTMLLNALMIFVAVIFVLSLALKIPGLEILIRPIFVLLQKLITYVVASASSWLLWFIQHIWRAHRDVIGHLCHDEEHYDIRLRVERTNRRS